MVETPAARRYRVAKAARIEHGGDKIACTLYDLSRTGTAIEVANPARQPRSIHTGFARAWIESAALSRARIIASVLHLNMPAQTGSGLPDSHMRLPCLLGSGHRRPDLRQLALE